MKKLLKVIDLDFSHRDEHINTLNDYFNEKVETLEARRVASGKKYLDYKQKASDQETMVKDKKKPNGVKLSKEELEKAKEDLKYYKAFSSDSLSDYNRCERQKNQFKEHLKILEQRK